MHQTISYLPWINPWLLICVLFNFLRQVRGDNSGSTHTFSPGLDWASLSILGQQFTNTAMGNSQTTAYITWPKSLKCQCNDFMPNFIWQWPAIDVSTSKLIKLAYVYKRNIMDYEKRTKRTSRTRGHMLLAWPRMNFFVGISILWDPMIRDFTKRLKELNIFCGSSCKPYNPLLIWSLITLLSETIISQSSQSWPINVWRRFR